MVVYLSIMSIDRDDIELSSKDLVIDAEALLAQFETDEANSMADRLSAGTETGRLIHTVTVRPESPRGAVLVIGEGQALRPNFVRSVPGLRFIHAGEDHTVVRVIDINRTPGSGQLGLVTVTDLLRWGDDYSVSNMQRSSFKAGQAFTLSIEPTSVVKYYFAVDGAEMLGDEDIARKLGHMSPERAAEFNLVCNVDHAIGKVADGSD